MFTQDVIRAAAAAAERNSVEPAALLAVIEVECAGQPLEVDGRTPRLLFERHVFYRELRKQASKLAIAIARGLAIPKWSPKTQYKDQGRSIDRLKLIGRARDVDEDKANRSASWAMGQTMGFHAEEIGFRSATDMVNYLTQGGLPAQIDVMCRNISQMGLWDELQRQDWAGFARRYNGSGYRTNKYDTKMEAAYARWCRKLANGTAISPLAALPKYEVEALQNRLKELGYSEVGKVDGKPGTRTTAALTAFQQYEGLPTTGILDDATKQALATAIPREVSPERQAMTIADLRDDGSETVKEAEAGATVTKAGIGGGILYTLKEWGALDWMQSASDYVPMAKSILAALKEIGAEIGPYAGIIVAAVGLYLFLKYRKIIFRRVADEVSGAHAGR